MKKTLFKNLLVPALIYAVAAHAGLYKGLDEDGNVVYSDKPFDDAQEFTPPSLSIVDSPRVKAKEEASKEEKPADFKYTDFDISSPKNNETIWNEPNLTVSLHLKPSLNTAQGHNIWLLMGGKPVVKNSQSPSLQIGRHDRGAHQLQAQVRDKQGKIIARTRAIVIHIKNSVVRPQLL